MHLVETYALNCGLKIDKPYIYRKYCPLPFDKFISFQPCSKYDSKSYDFWQEVINQLIPKLHNEGIHIVQIGGKDEKPIENCYHLQGKTTINQAAYIISKSLVHFGADSFGVHIASCYNKPLVALYSNSLPENAGPYFGEKNNHILLEINKENRKPSYSAQENPKTINEIDPIKITNAILQKLNLPPINIKTIFLGESYHRKLVESVPDSVISDIRKLGVDSLIMRMDYNFNEDVLNEQLKRNPCSIVTDKTINFNILNQSKHNISQIIYILNNDNDIKFVQNIKKLGKPFALVTKQSEEFIKSIKYNYMDYDNIIKENIFVKNNIKDIENINIDNMYYKSNKFTISLGKIYNSKAAYLKKIEYTNSLGSIIDIPEFWEEAKYLYIFELTKN